MEVDPNIPEPNHTVKPQPGNDLDSEEEIQQPHCFTQTTCPVTHLQPTMQGQHHHNITLITDGEIADVNLCILGHVLTQLSLKQGLSQWKKCSEEAVAKELSQLFSKIHLNQLTPLP